MSATPTGPDGTEVLTEVLAPVIERAGLELEEASISEGTPRIVRVVVDREDGPDSVGLEEIAELSAPLGEALDASVMTGDEPYELEVSSPGATRPLTLPRHWRRNVQRMVKLVTFDGEDVGGLLLGADEDGIEIEPVRPPAKKGMKSKTLDPVRIGYDRIRRGTVDIEATAARQLNRASEEG